jgi:hypothetical protein
MKTCSALRGGPESRIQHIWLPFSAYRYLPVLPNVYGEGKSCEDENKLPLLKEGGPTSFRPTCLEITNVAVWSQHRNRFFANMEVCQYALYWGTHIPWSSLRKQYSTHITKGRFYRMTQAETPFIRRYFPLILWRGPDILVHSMHECN